MIHAQPDHGILRLTMQSRPGNMLDREDIGSLSEQVERAARTQEITGILLTGEDRSFCTGLNLAQVGEGGEKTDDFFESFESLLYKLFTLPKPVVAAVNGHCVGGGLLLQCCADRVCTADDRRIKIGLPEVNLGLTIDRFMHILLGHCCVSDKKLATMLLTGEYLTPGQALEAGFTDDLVAPEALPEQAERRLLELAGKPCEAFAATKSLVRDAAAARLSAALQEKSYRIFNSILANNVRHD